VRAGTEAGPYRSAADREPADREAADREPADREPADRDVIRVVPRYGQGPDESSASLGSGVVPAFP